MHRKFLFQKRDQCIYAYHNLLILYLKLSLFLSPSLYLLFLIQFSKFPLSMKDFTLLNLMNIVNYEVHKKSARCLYSNEKISYPSYHVLFLDLSYSNLKLFNFILHVIEKFTELNQYITKRQLLIIFIKIFIIQE